MKWLSKFKRLWGKGEWLDGAGRLCQSRDWQAFHFIFLPFVNWYTVFGIYNLWSS